VVVLLLRTMDSLRQLFTMSMDAHHRFRTAAHKDVVPRFNERFLLSLAQCQSALVLDDELNVLPVSAHARALGAAAEGGVLDDGEEGGAGGGIGGTALPSASSESESSPEAKELAKV